ncbi:hypothetical protein BMI91_15315 [Thioclava sediminum]|uniref:HTH lysR-type domain-containing protein n=1 Tax=Thioclava sediminum TaxID=1915319 RepID=A0ABX3MVW4_9RHOB|nr:MULTISPECIES: LysR substrate-binding domain-containing protein [Thioclava]OOY23815.1 hypothetical protein BMI91_15315 [Thioclava sediminum]OOY30369.1 hypothetical protein BMI88_14360 [Thioclava sp. F36-6]
MAMHKGLKLRHIRAFLDTIEAGGVSAAARKQGISQPALSKTLSEMEAMLGGALLERRGRRLTVTPAGEAFRRHAIQALQELEAGAAALSGDGIGDVINVGALPTVAGSIFPGVALDFSRAHPGTRLSISTGPNLYLLDRIRSGALDLMIGRMPAAGDMPGLRFDFLYEEEVILAARAGHPFANSPAPEALRQCDVILPTRGAIIRRIVDDYLGAQGITEPRCPIETVSLATGLGLLEGSDMLWFISRGVVARELASGLLVSLPLGAQFMSGAVGLTMKHEMTERPEVARLTAMMHEAARLREATTR